MFKWDTKRSQTHILKSLGVTLRGKGRRKFSWVSSESLFRNHHWISDIAAYRNGEGC